MNARSAALLEQAKRQGYPVMRYGYNNRLKAHYFEWWRSQKIPAIYVWFHGMSASLDTNTEPMFLGYFDSETDGGLFDSPDFTPTPELYERCAASMLRSSRWMYGCLLYQAGDGSRGRERTMGHLAAPSVYSRMTRRETVQKAAFSENTAK